MCLAGLALLAGPLGCAHYGGVQTLPERRAASIAAYGGKWSDNRWVEIMRLETAMGRSYLYAVAMAGELARPLPALAFEGEANVARHAGRQHHTELNAALLARWHWFPWDRYLNTSFAHGIGPSYATTPPPLEGNRDEPATRHQLFMVTELAVAPPAGGGWETFVRVHHRSGVFGLVSEASGTNFISLGLRYRFGAR